MTSTNTLLALGALCLFALSSNSLLATELITNGNFGSGTTAWTLDLLNGAKGSLNVEMNANAKAFAHVQVPEAATVPYYVQLFQNQLPIKTGQTYHLTFRARAKSDIGISVNLMVAAAPWTNLWKQDIKLTSDWQNFTFDITPSQSADNARVTFSGLGAQPTEYWFTDVSLAY